MVIAPFGHVQFSVNRRQQGRPGPRTTSIPGGNRFEMRPGVAQRKAVDKGAGRRRSKRAPRRYPRRWRPKWRRAFAIARVLATEVQRAASFCSPVEASASTREQRQRGRHGRYRPSCAATIAGSVDGFERRGHRPRKRPASPCRSCAGHFPNHVGPGRPARSVLRVDLSMFFSLARFWG